MRNEIEITLSPKRLKEKFSCLVCSNSPDSDSVMTSQIRRKVTCLLCFKKRVSETDRLIQIEVMAKVAVHDLLCEQHCDVSVNIN